MQHTTCIALAQETHETYYGVLARKQLSRAELIPDHEADTPLVPAPLSARRAREGSCRFLRAARAVWCEPPQEPQQVHNCEPRLKGEQQCRTISLD